MTVKIHTSWHKALAGEFDMPYWKQLTTFVKEQYSQQVCFPQGKYIFRAFDLTPFGDVKVVILGQDPYHTPGAAMGLAFSVPDGAKAQPSLKNIFGEMHTDIAVTRTNTDLTDWANQGILLLNSVLTVQKGVPASHKNKGWETFTDAAIRALSKKREGIVFVLWGNYAIAKKSLIDTGKHHIVSSPHPSPFSAHKGFFGSRPFSQIDQYIHQSGQDPIQWN